MDKKISPEQRAFANGQTNCLSSANGSVKPLLVIHGGAGNITRKNLSPESEAIHRAAMLKVLEETQPMLLAGCTALEAACHAVKMLEDDPLFNSGKGAVFTKAGTNELEASVMVSNGHHKRGSGVMLLKTVKNPILLAKEMLLQGDQMDGGGAAGHVQISGDAAEDLAKQWGLDIVDPSYFWTKKRWDEHKRGLKSKTAGQAATHLDEDLVGRGEEVDEEGNVCEYLPQGTVGAVALDMYGNLCTATSTGGLTNKLPGRIGDTPTFGAGYWAESWNFLPPKAVSSEVSSSSSSTSEMQMTSSSVLSKLSSLLAKCGFPRPSNTDIYRPYPTDTKQKFTSSFESDLENFGRSSSSSPQSSSGKRAIAMSGTGNGDSFLRISASRTIGAICKYSSLSYLPIPILGKAMAMVIGKGGDMQKSAGDRWAVTGEGEGGGIGIEYLGHQIPTESVASPGFGTIFADMNCGGMFRAKAEAPGEFSAAVFWDDKF